jgi:hypothetical protein
MLKTIQKHMVLWVQSKTGVTLVFLVAMTFAATAILMTFFLCVAAYAWASVELEPAFGGLATAGVFLLIALIGAVVSVGCDGKPGNRSAARERCSIPGRFTSPSRPAARLAGSASYPYC